MSYTPPYSPGQTTKANSAPVTIASDQELVVRNVQPIVIASGVTTSGTVGGTVSVVQQNNPTYIESFVKGGQVTVASGITANAGTNLNTSALALETGGNLAAAATSLAVLDDWDETDRAKVNSIVGQAGVQGGSGAVSANTQRVVLATDVALPAGTNAIGKLSANTGVDIGDVDVTSVIPGTSATNLGKAEDVGHSSGDTGVYVLAVRDDVPAAHSGSDNDYESLHTNRDGMLWVTRGPQESDLATQATTHVKKYYTNAGAVTDGIIWSPAAGKRWYVTDIFINVSAAATVTLEDDLAAGDSPVWKAELAANSGWSHSFETPLYSGEDAADLLITTSAGNVYVTVTGYEI